MIEDYTNIEELLERFFDGKTSNKEEERLYSFFRKEDIPGHLKQYKQVFEYFESGLEDEINEEIQQNNTAKPVFKQKILWTIVSGIAAAIFLFIFLQPWNIVETDPLEGSYIVKNGQRIDDLDKIRGELEKTVEIALLQQEYADRILSVSLENEDPSLQIEQEIKSQYCDIIHQFADAKIREEVKAILHIECDIEE